VGFRDEWTIVDVDRWRFFASRINSRPERRGWEVDVWESGLKDGVAYLLFSRFQHHRIYRSKRRKRHFDEHERLRLFVHVMTRERRLLNRTFPFVATFLLVTLLPAARPATALGGLQTCSRRFYTVLNSFGSGTDKHKYAVLGRRGAESATVMPNSGMPTTERFGIVYNQQSV
jgi:hypothetical protein